MNRAAEAIVTEKDIVDFESDGVVCLRRVLDGDWVDRMQGAVDRITENPGPMRESYYPDKPGDFFSEKFMWTFDGDFRFYVFESPVAAAVGRLMRTRRLNFFYDHLLVKEPGTVSATEWHQDTNFWPFSGRQIASLWAPLDRVTRENGVLEFVRGSHLWHDRPMSRPTIFGDRNGKPQDVTDKEAGPVDDAPGQPDIANNRDQFDIVSWELDPCRSSKPCRPRKSWHFRPLPATICGMQMIVVILVAFVREIVLSRARLQLENIALRQQVAVLKRDRPRPQLHPLDRVFWVFVSRLWPRWKDALVIVKPETVVGWHRQGFRLYWKWKSCHGKPGRPRTSKETRELIQRLSRENPLWGAPRIHGELLKLGIDVSQATVTRYMVRHPKPPSQNWLTFLNNHVGCLVSIDFFVVPTATFAVLFVFIVLRHERRRIEHFGVTAHPSADWVAQQIREAFPWDTAPRYLIRDRDGAYGQSFRSTVMAMGVEEVVTAPRSPWQNPYVERLIGSVRRECLNHVIVLNERPLRRILVSYLDYYHRHRTHLSLGKDTPEGRSVQPGGTGKIVAFPQVGGLHHRYERLAA